MIGSSYSKLDPLEEKAAAGFGQISCGDYLRVFKICPKPVEEEEEVSFLKTKTS
jgi:hypothetical protein